MGGIVIVDYGMGNLGSVRNILNYLGYESRIADTAKEVAAASDLILPGVGHFKKAMANIRKRELDKALEFAVFERGSRVLGICLGMQLLLEHSEEGNCDGLGYIRGGVFRFPDGPLKIPHMGWNTVNWTAPYQERFMKEDARFYFVHSYYAKCENASDVAATAEYGIRFDAVVKSGNVMGVQFHPEKSHIYGMHFLNKYMETTSCITTE